jgi:hypothetical protein
MLSTWLALGLVAGKSRKWLDVLPDCLGLHLTCACMFLKLPLQFGLLSPHPTEVRQEELQYTSMSLCRLHVLSLDLPP